MGKKNIGGAVLDDLKALPKKILKPYYKNGKLNANKIAIDGIQFVIIFYVINKYVQAVVSADGGDMLDKCVKAFSLIFQVKPYFAPSFKLTPLICGIGAGVAFKLFMNSRKKNAKQFRPREEYGSAKWGTDKDFEPYTDPVKVEQHSADCNRVAQNDETGTSKVRQKQKYPDCRRFRSRKNKRICEAVTYADAVFICCD